MFYLILLFLHLPVLSSSNQEQQIIHIRVDEELPISTILFTTTNSITYRLFDTGRNQNSFVRYDSSTGQLLLARSIDREYLCSQRICSCTQCQLTIELIEWQLPYRLLQLILNVDDINDHTPIFSSKNSRFPLMENVPIGYEIALEQAQDADLGENSRINYELQRLDSTNNHSNDPLTLLTKINGGLVLKVVNDIDREERDHYEYQLIAFDNGQPKKQSSTKLFIEIEDMNDNPVQLSQTHIRLNVSENTPIGTELTRIHATDQDIGLNGKIHYSITSGLPSSTWMDYFRIHDSTGILILVGSLDYESEQSYRLTIQVRDLGENSLARFLTIDISIIDENDNHPQASLTFVQPLINDSIISIRENTPLGQILAYVSISDQDSGLNSQMSYRIEQGNEWIGIRTIDQKSFLLIVEQFIDRENLNNDEMKRFILNIYDQGQPSKNLRLEYQISIVDENDSPPRFNQSIHCHIEIDSNDNQTLDTNEVLFQVQATDDDLDENGRISYSILPPYDNSFGINDQGEVFASEMLNQSFTYHLRIMAIDHGKITQLNSIENCSIRIMKKEIEIESSMDIDEKQPMDQMSFPLFEHYSYIIIGLFLFFVFIILIIVTICLIFCFHALLFHHRKKSKQLKYYDPIHRKSPFGQDESRCSSRKSDENEDLTSEERERLVHFNNSDQTSCESSDSMNQQIRIVNQNRPLSNHQNYSRIIRNSYPPSPYLSSMPSVGLPPPKPPRDSGYESICLTKQSKVLIPGRPLSLSISTATTYTSSGTDSSSSPLPTAPIMNTFRPPYSSFKHPNPTANVVRLAEEEKIDV